MWQIIGQDKAVSFLQQSLEKGQIAHAILLVGPPHVGKMTLAMNVAQALNCSDTEPPCGACFSCQKIASSNHPDVQVIGLAPLEGSGEAKSRTEISIEQIREMKHAAYLPPFEGKHKVFIIDGAELLSNEAANCLLKTLEEPVGGVVFILLTRNDRLLPATVISRCQCLELLPVPSAVVEAALINTLGIEPQKASLLAHFSRGCSGWAIAAAHDEAVLELRNERLEKLREVIDGDLEVRFACASQLATQFGQNRQSVLETLDVWIDYWHDMLLIKAGQNDTITNIDRVSVLNAMAEKFTLSRIRAVINSIQAAADQLKQNANPRLVLEVLMLDIPAGAGRAAVT